MSMLYGMYLTPTAKEARRVGLMAKRLHGKPLGRCVAISKLAIGPKGPIFREPQYGNPRVRVDYQISTPNCALASDDFAWDKAIELYETHCYPVAYTMSWILRWARIWGLVG